MTPTHLQARHCCDILVIDEGSRRPLFSLWFAGRLMSFLTRPLFQKVSILSLHSSLDHNSFSSLNTCQQRNGKTRSQGISQVEYSVWIGKVLFREGQGFLIDVSSSCHGTTVTPGGITSVSRQVWFSTASATCHSDFERYYEACWLDLGRLLRRHRLLCLGLLPTAINPTLQGSRSHLCQQVELIPCAKPQCVCRA